MWKIDKERVAAEDSTHKTSDAITKRAAILCIESLNVAGMVKNHHLAKAVSDASMAELHRQLRYKMASSGGLVVEADRFYPSSKTCSRCGVIKQDLALADRVFKCTCGLEIDRDLNAAINLKNLAVSSTVTACGLEGARGPRMKQEPNSMEALA